MSWWIVLCGLCFLVGHWLRDLPSLLPAVHRRLYRLWHARRSRPRGGRPRVPKEHIGLIHQMRAQNPSWGATRIHGELLKMDIRISQSTVSRYLARRPVRPAPGWLAFLVNHADAIAAIDMLCVVTARFERLYAFVVMSHGRRAILHVEVTGHPTALWLARQITEAFPWDEAPRFLIRDNDGAYGMTFRRRVRAMGIRDRPTRPYSPWQNGTVERLIGSIRRECLDHIVIFNERHLRRVLSAYAAYYNHDRTHLGLNKDTPLGRPIETEGEIASIPILGGLHHRYYRKRTK